MEQKSPFRGAVSLTLDPAGNETSFYADNVVYFSAYANNGYTGTIEFAHIPDGFKQACSAGPQTQTALWWRPLAHSAKSLP